MARRRLELLSAELAATRPEPVLPRPEQPATDGSGGPPGRHARRPVGARGRVVGWVEDRLPPSLQGRVRIGAGHLALLTTVAAIAMGLLAWSTVRAADPGDLAPARSEVDSHVEPLTALATPASASPPGSALPGAPPTDDQGEVVVDVAGKVRRPGIVRLPLGSRVVDALEAAGGARRGADLTGLNLARVLSDGEQVLVGVPAPAGPAAASPGATAAGGVLVNLNTATQTELETLPGVGPVTAASILEWRAERGAFSSVDELLEVSGIGDATLAEIAPHVTL